VVLCLKLKSPYVDLNTVVFWLLPAMVKQKKLYVL
jgi:hypothetical protein